MTSLTKISDIATRYNVSTRTLRYYEEIGLLRSERPDPGQPRAYAPDAIRRLEQILALRRLQIPIREIQHLLTARDPAEALDGLWTELRRLEGEERQIQERRAMLESLLAFFRQEQQDRRLEGPALPAEIVAMAERTLEQRRRGGIHPVDAQRERHLTSVRIVQLEPMRMARYHDPVAPSCFDTWRHMIAWACGYGLPTTRAFGYTSPNPTGIVPRYGYEVLFALPDGFEPRGHIEAVAFPGGLYAVTTTWYRDCTPDWRALDRWVQTHPEYTARPGLFLEELNSFSLPVDENSVVDIFYPICQRLAKEA
jgi:DNA-binding transcriptional MerR regulator